MLAHTRSGAQSSCFLFLLFLSLLLFCFHCDGVEGRIVGRRPEDGVQMFASAVHARQESFFGLGKAAARDAAGGGGGGSDGARVKALSRCGLDPMCMLFSEFEDKFWEREEKVGDGVWDGSPLSSAAFSAREGEQESAGWVESKGGRQKRAVRETFEAAAVEEMKARALERSARLDRLYEKATSAEERSEGVKLTRTGGPEVEKGAAKVEGREEEEQQEEEEQKREERVALDVQREATGEREAQKAEAFHTVEGRRRTTDWSGGTLEEGRSAFEGKRSVLWSSASDDEDEDLILRRLFQHRADRFCSGIGIAEGIKQNICSLQNCYPTKLRCPPEYYTEHNPRAYSGNLSACYVEAVACEDETFSFFDWARTSIRSLTCVDGSVRIPDEGDLQHCSIREVEYGDSLFNFTLSEEEFCVKDELDCPHTCSFLQVKCSGDALKCHKPGGHRCVNGTIYCGTFQRKCAGRPIKCSDFHHVTCADDIGVCQHWRLACDGVDQCGIDGKKLSCNETRYNIPLLECRGHAHVCSSYYVSCQGEAVHPLEVVPLDPHDVITAVADPPTIHRLTPPPRTHVSCVDAPTPYTTYRPQVGCKAPLDECELEVFCAGEARGGGEVPQRFLSCDNSSTVFRYNGTHAVCVLQPEAYLNHSSPLPFPQSRHEWRDAVITQVAHCPGDTEFARCKFDNVTSDGYPQCSAHAFSCHNNKWDAQYPVFDVLDVCEGNVTYNSTHVFCDDVQQVCTVREKCPVARRSCEDVDDHCFAAAWECAEEQPGNCRYRNMTCGDVCWQREGDWRCTCPADAIGEHCEQFRDYQCRFELVSPQLQCDASAYERGLDSDPVCLVQSVSQALSLEYRMQCVFVDFEDIDASLNETFNYFVFADDGTFAVNSEKRVSLDDDELDHEDMRVALSVFNMLRTSDYSQNIVKALTPDQILGRESIYFQVATNTLYRSSRHRQRYYAGGRLYFEVDLYHNPEMDLGGGQIERNPDRRFLDFSDIEAEFEEPPLPDWLSSFFYFFYEPSLVAVIVVFLSGLVFYSKYSQYFQQQRLVAASERRREHSRSAIPAS